MPTGYYIRTEEHKENLRNAIKKTHAFNTGRKLSKEHKENLKKNHVGNTGKVLSEQTRAKISSSNIGRISPMKGRKMTDSHKKAIGKTNSNPTIETRIKKSIATLKRVADGSHNFYKGGVSKENELIRKSFEYRLWRTSVFERDTYTCQICGTVGGELRADHIKSFALYPELRFAIDNGRTLCDDCHRKTDNFGWKNNIKTHD